MLPVLSGKGDPMTDAMFPKGFLLRKADYAVDFDATGYAKLLDAMFTAYDRNRDGVVTAEEYVDPIPK
jgi:hypothetical protein